MVSVAIFQVVVSERCGKCGNIYSGSVGSVVNVAIFLLVVLDRCSKCGNISGDSVGGVCGKCCNIPSR